MKNLYKCLLTIFFTSLLGGCVLFHGYAPPVQQGNVINANKVSELQTGMSQYQVLALMGSPVYVNTFKDNQMVYVYTYQVSGHRMSEKRVIINFRNGRITSIRKNLNPNMVPKKLY